MLVALGLILMILAALPKPSAKVSKTIHFNNFGALVAPGLILVILAAPPKPSAKVAQNNQFLSFSSAGSRRSYFRVLGATVLTHEAIGCLQKHDAFEICVDRMPAKT